MITIELNFSFSVVKIIKHISSAHKNESKSASQLRKANTKTIKQTHNNETP